MIRGEIIQLRPATLHDRRQIYEWLAHTDTTSQMMGPPFFPDQPIPSWEEFVSDYTTHYFEDNTPYLGRSFIIEANGIAVGHINYNTINNSTHIVELDIWLAGSKNCGRGFGTDAINTLCNYLNKVYSCNTFILAPSARNKAAIKAYEKCGFHQSRDKLLHFIPDYIDTVVMIKRVSE